MSTCVICKFPNRCRVQNCLLEVPLCDDSYFYWSTTSIELAKGAVASSDSCPQSIGILIPAHNFSVILCMKNSTKLNDFCIQLTRPDTKACNDSPENLVQLNFADLTQTCLKSSLEEKIPGNQKLLADLKQVPQATTAFSPTCEVFAICSMVIDH